MKKDQMEPKAVIVIFGATGDLAKRKLYPSIHRLYENGQIGNEFAVVGVGRRPWTNEDFRSTVQQSVSKFPLNEKDVDEFTSHFYYHPFDVTNSGSYRELNELIEKLESTYDIPNNRMFYLAMAPEFFGTIAKFLKSEGVTSTTGWSRLVIEKPFGHDLPSAKALNQEIREAFTEDQIYRIDHYLGKQMVQNIEVIRFANAILSRFGQTDTSRTFKLRQVKIWVWKTERDIMKNRVRLETWCKTTFFKWWRCLRWNRRSS